MGLFDSIAGQVMGSLAGSGNDTGNVLKAMGGLLNDPQNGGLQGLMQRFEQNGLGAVAASWVGKGENLPISAEQIQAVLGNAQVQAIAQQFGFSADDLAQKLATLMPKAVDTLTPDGKLPDSGAMGGMLDLLKLLK